MTEDQEVVLIWRALTNLRLADPIWGKNCEIFRNMTTSIRLQWWAKAQQQAKAGVPAMQALVTEVIKLRLKG